MNDRIILTKAGHQFIDQLLVQGQKLQQSKLPTLYKNKSAHCLLSKKSYLTKITPLLPSILEHLEIKLKSYNNTKMHSKMSTYIEKILKKQAKNKYKYKSEQLQNQLMEVNTYLEKLNSNWQKQKKKFSQIQNSIKTRKKSMITYEKDNDLLKFDWSYYQNYKIRYNERVMQIKNKKYNFSKHKIPEYTNKYLRIHEDNLNRIKKLKKSKNKVKNFFDL